MKGDSLRREVATRKAYRMASEERAWWRHIFHKLGIREQMSFEHIVDQVHNLLQSLQSLLGNARWKGDELWALCPYHDDRSVGSFSVNRTGQFHCFVCGASGSMFKLLYKLGIPESEIKALLESIDFDDLIAMMEQTREIEAEEEETVPSLPESLLGTFSANRPQLLLDRGHPPELIDRLEISVDLVRSRVIYPIRRATGELVAFQSRALLPVPKADRWKFYKRELIEMASEETVRDFNLREYTVPRAKVLYNEVSTFSTLLRGTATEPLVITEGPGHVLRVLACGFPCLGTFGTSPSRIQVKRIKALFLRAQELTGRRSEVILAYDGDPAGRKACALLGHELSDSAYVRIALLPPGKDPEDLTVKELRPLLKNAPSYSSRIGTPTIEGNAINDALGERNRRYHEQQERLRRKLLWEQKMKAEEDAGATSSDTVTKRLMERVHAKAQCGSECGEGEGRALLSRRSGGSQGGSPEGTAGTSRWGKL